MGIIIGTHFLGYFNIYNMNANQSKQKTDERRLELGRQQLNRIIDTINKAIKRPAEETVFFETITPENLSLLRSSGYTVTKEGGRQGENNHRISWRSGQTSDINTFDTTYYPGGLINPQYPL
jgi:hypothetical protein